MGSSIGIRMNHYKDSYEASSTMECNKMFFLKSPQEFAGSLNCSELLCRSLPVPSSVMLIS